MKNSKERIFFLQLGIFPNAPETVHSWGSYHCQIWHGSHCAMCVRACQLLTIQFIAAPVELFFLHGQLQNLVWLCPKSHGRPRRCRVPKKVKAGGDSAGYEFAESGPFCSENLQMFTTNPVTTSCVYHCSAIKVLTLTVVHSGTAPTKKFVASAGTFQVSCVHNTVSPWT